MSIFDSYYSSNYKQRETELLKLNYRISWAYMNNKKYGEAQQSFENSAFDPFELLKKVFPNYLPESDMKSLPQGSYKKEQLTFLTNLFRNKRKNILRQYPNPEQESIRNIHNQGPEVKASVWLEYIDYALVKCMIELKMFPQLAEFFKTSGKVYCRDIRSDIEVFSNEITKNLPTEEKLKFTILAFLNEIVGLYSKSLECWKQVSLVNKVGEPD